MLVTETIEINGVQYDDAVDPVNSGRVYTETNVPVTVLEVPEEFRQENLE